MELVRRRKMLREPEQQLQGLPDGCYGTVREHRVDGMESISSRPPTTMQTRSLVAEAPVPGAGFDH